MEPSPGISNEPAAPQRRGGIGAWLRQHVQCVLVFVICVVVVAFVWDKARDAAWRDLDRGLNRTADQIRSDFASKFERQEQVLYVCRALFDASERVTRSDWRVFVEGIGLETNAPGVVGLAFIERVPAERLGAFVAGMRAEGVEDFAVRERGDADGSAPGDVSYVIKYHEPEAVNGAALGVDVSTHAQNRSIYDDAAAADAVRVSAGFSLVQFPAPNYGMVMALPVYGQGADGERVVLGWATAAVLLDRFVDSVWQESWNGFRLDMTMQDDNGSATIFRTSASDYGCTPELATGSHQMTRSIDQFGRTIMLRVTPANERHLTPDMRNADLVVMIGGLATAMVTMVVWSATSTRQRAVAIARDMTDSLRASEALQRELAGRAEQASKAKSEFLANMSHEIRTPMTAIMGYAELIDSGEMDEKTRVESVQAMRRAGRHLLTIINDVLDISKIESGHMRVFEEPCGLRPLFDDVLGGLRNQAAHGHNTLRAEVSGPVPDTVLTDPHRVRQILINLVGNALKFTSHGSVTMRVSHEDGWLRVDVEDTGVGISADKLDSIFRPFEQGDASSTRRHEGTGLGLAISRRLADLLGGNLSARSSPGEGSVFTLHIPAPGAEDAAPVSELTERASPAGGTPAMRLRGRVLLVEDGQDNQKLISFILRKAGLEVELASNGVQAVARVARGEDFDLIITDMQMPEMDGYEATRRLRAMGFVLPILALTANAMSGDRARCLDAGCDDYAAKPIDRGSLLATVERMLIESARRARPAA